MLICGLDAIQSYRPFQQGNTKFLPYRDAGKGPSLYNLEVIDVLKGVHRATQLGWVDFRTFDIKSYEFFERVENGDWNWIVPGKFLAFATPKGNPKNYYELRPRECFFSFHPCFSFSANSTTKPGCVFFLLLLFLLFFCCVFFLLCCCFVLLAHSPLCSAFQKDGSNCSRALE